jgi:1-acyl-sn-glycerol-3-phosphate acyltransferase
LILASVGLFSIFSSVVRNADEHRRTGTVNYSWPRNMIPADITFQVLAITSVIVHFVASRILPNVDSAFWERLRWVHLFILGLLIFLFAWIRLFRPFFELCVEAVVGRNYRVAAVGPGVKVPFHGPLIVIANHACMWDPLFLAKALPRPVTPMMTSLYYDRWYIKPLVKHVFGTIRVPDSRARREAPEIQDAIRALDEGKCLLLFPESFLRRKEEIPLRRFGRGIWEILKARPDTPVVCCWIEGAWGSYSSHWNGPPTKNKPKEGRRTITIGMSEPIRIPAEAIERHLATRIHLMNEVAAARKHLGLEPLPAFVLSVKDDEPEQPA